MSTFKYFMETEHPRVVSCMWYARPAAASVKGYCKSTVSVWSPRNEDYSS